MRPAHALIPCLLAAVLAAPAAHAAFPQTPPNDPEYASAENGDCNKDSVNDEQHYLYSFMPRCATNASDAEGASGMSVDKAWKTYGTGRPDVVIAYVEAGGNLENGQPELIDKWALNAGELPPPTTPTDDGVLNVQDYADTPDANGNHVLDPEDLIVRFSDGRDSDDNGYTDDIAGWDFYDDQNDPFTYDGAYGHSNGQMEQAAAKTDNGIGRAGVCPRCMILPIKAGAEALDRTNDLAEAWNYAVDRGSSVIVSVTADLGYSSFMRRVVNRAWNKGVVMVEASNDFNSIDHQGGMFWPHVIPGNGSVSDTQGVPQATAANNGIRSFRARSGLTSWGTHNLFTAATRGGSTSESTPTHGGVFGLLMSAGRDYLDPPLTAAEAVQVARATASDTDDPNLGWPGKPGWDLQYGYGRYNVYKAMKAIHDGDIPPVAWFTGPRWYSLYDPATQDAVRISGHLDAPRSRKAFAWKLEYGLGPEPSDWSTIAHGESVKAVDGHLGTLKLADIPKSFWDRAMTLSKRKELESNDRFTVTLRLSAVDADGRRGEERRAIAVHHDPTLELVKRIGASGEAQPQIATLQGRRALVFGDTDGRVHAIDGRTGEELPGWPVRTDRLAITHRHGRMDADVREPVIQSAAIGDLDHDGAPWVVVTTETGKTYVWDAEGRRRDGFPRALDTGIQVPPIPRRNLPYTRLPAQGATSPPVLQDLDGDQRPEIVQAGWDGHIHAFETSHPGEAPGWPVEVKRPDGQTQGHMWINDHKLDAAPCIADLDGDGRPEVVIRSQWIESLGGGIQPLGVQYLHAYHADGTPVAGWPAKMPSVIEYYGSAQEFITEGANMPVAADVDGDGKDEVAADPLFSPSYLFNGDGTPRTTYGPTPNAALDLLSDGADPTALLQRALPTDASVGFTTSGAFGHVGPQGTLAFAQPGSGGASIIGSLLLSGTGIPLRNHMRAFDALSGAALPGYPTLSQGLDFLGAPAIADVDGDGAPDILEGGDSSALHAFGPGGKQAAGFPKFQTGWTVFAPSVGDVDGDGKLDVASTTREGYLMVWRTEGSAKQAPEWPSYRHDLGNTARYR